jgi:hypothetical protein
MKLKLLKIIIFSVITLFFLAVLISRLTSEDKSLKRASQIDMYVDKLENYKGLLTLNDSIYVSTNCPQIIEKSSFIVTEKNPPLWRPKNKPYFPSIGDVTKPFRIIKKAYSDTIEIIKDRDTLYFIRIEL